jgi:hypothetical protein
MSQDLKKDIKVNADTAVFMWCGSTSLSLAPATSNVPKKYRRANAN